ncbi:MAG: AAA family ATPase [Candidatus Jettenia sp.]|nr:MAG: AAA family ATPase [Candidatus Jettenia sp. AMX1]MBC6928880.1 AAA family ATPase [Candidatus Jettenia sp.]MCE7879881.1 AAA family ATPase [Candidatus Jettenia sp. AMX1]MCQ3926660.1 AAA family ATPase [Candidatus Jettenia sp.]MDL1938440.1 AAA family ATPase [Candidatus Jettenia sp. AMX1]
MFKRAQKSLSKARICLCGPAGSGKTYSALRVASGLGNRIAMIDTEHGSGALYSDMLDYDILELQPPFDCTKYINAIKEAENQGYNTIIIDSLSHAWAGEGGLLDFHAKVASGGKDNSYTAWRQVTPLHTALIEAMLQSKCHIIATARSKMEYAIDKDTSGKTIIRKIGMQPVFRDGLEYEFMIFFDLSQEHTATATKDRTSLFDGKYFKITRETGEMIYTWLTSNNDKPVLNLNQTQTPINEQKEAHKLRDLYLPRNKEKLDEKKLKQKAFGDNTEFLKCIEKMKGRVDPDTFNEICKQYEPLDKLYDRAKQIELYNRLKEKELFAMM